jgi:hypothetical protein
MDQSRQPNLNQIQQPAIVADITDIAENVFV